MPKPDELMLYAGQRVECGIGTMECEGMIDSGGMGALFRMSRVGNASEKAWAVKTVLPEFARNEEILQRFNQECASLSRIRHPNVLDVDCLTWTTNLPVNIPLIFMELLSGFPLRKVMQANMAYYNRLDIACQLLAANAAVHKQGIIHRDVKPENIFLDDPGNGTCRVVLIDFGIISELRGRGHMDDSERGRMIGTPGYAAPEQMRGEKPSDQTDLWATSVVLYELFARRRMFSDVIDVSDVNALCMHHMLHTPTPLREIDPSVPEGVAAMIEQGLRKVAAERPRSALEYRVPFDHARREYRRSGGAVTELSRFSFQVQPENVALSLRSPAPPLADGAGARATVRFGEGYAAGGNAISPASAPTSFHGRPLLDPSAGGAPTAPMPYGNREYRSEAPPPQTPSDRRGMVRQPTRLGEAIDPHALQPSVESNPWGSLPVGDDRFGAQPHASTTGPSSAPVRSADDRYTPRRRPVVALAIGGAVLGVTTIIVPLVYTVLHRAPVAASSQPAVSPAGTNPIGGVPGVAAAAATAIVPPQAGASALGAPAQRLPASPAPGEGVPVIRLAAEPVAPTPDPPRAAAPALPTSSPPVATSRPAARAAAPPAKATPKPAATVPDVMSDAELFAVPKVKPIPSDPKPTKPASDPGPGF